MICGIFRDIHTSLIHNGAIIADTIRRCRYRWTTAIVVVAHEVALKPLAKPPVIVGFWVTVLATVPVIIPAPVSGQWMAAVRGPSFTGGGRLCPADLPSPPSPLPPLLPPLLPLLLPPLLPLLLPPLLPPPPLLLLRPSFRHCFRPFDLDDRGHSSGFSVDIRTFRFGDRQRRRWWRRRRRRRRRRSGFRRFINGHRFRRAEHDVFDFEQKRVKFFELHVQFNRRHYTPLLLPRLLLANSGRRRTVVGRGAAFTQNAFGHGEKNQRQQNVVGLLPV